MENKQTPTLNVHPEEIIQTEYLDELNMTAYKLSKSINVQQSHVSKLLKGEIGISAEMAMRLGKFFGTSPSFWLNRQQYYDLRKVEIEKADLIDGIQHYQVA